MIHFLYFTFENKYITVIYNYYLFIDFIIYMHYFYIHRFSRTAYAKLEDIKKQSASGLKHAIEQQKYTEVLVDIKPSYVIIPHGGCYKK